MSSKEINRLTESTFQDQPDLELLDEVKLFRIYDRFTRHDPVGIITAYQSGNTADENNIANFALASELRSS